MKRVVFLFAAAMLVSAGAAQAETWRGVIGDSMCGAKHSEDKGTDHSACVAKCVKNGSAYVLVAKDKVFRIANQDFPDLKAHAGHVVLMSGELKGDVITVAKVEMPKAGDKAEKK